MSRIFQFQEDPEMAAVYNRQFEQEVALVQGNLTAPNNNQPLIMSGGLQLPFDLGYYGNSIAIMPGATPTAFVY
jgi:hypothetical protein